MLPDLDTTRRLLQAGQTSASAEMERCIATAQSPACAQVFARTLFDTARAGLRGLARPTSPGGLAVSVKDLFDVQGQTTPAGSLVLADAPAALTDSAAVARLRAAGAAFIGRTHMVNSHFRAWGPTPFWYARRL